MAVGTGRLVSGVGTAPCKVIHAHMHVKAAEDLWGLKLVLQKAWQVSSIPPIPRRERLDAISRCYQDRSPGWMRGDTKGRVKDEGSDAESQR